MKNLIFLFAVLFSVNSIAGSLTGSGGESSEPTVNKNLTDGVYPSAKCPADTEDFVYLYDAWQETCIRKIKHKESPNNKNLTDGVYPTAKCPADTAKYTFSYDKWQGQCIKFPKSDK